MPAQQQHHIQTAYMTGASSGTALGTVLCFTNTATDRFVIATTANLSTYGQNPAGITIEIGNGSSVEMQVVGFVPANITGLGAGSATTVCVNSSGFLARGSSPSVVGTCDAEGNAQVNFPGVGVGGGGGATPGGTVGMVQTNDGASGFAGTAHGAVGSVLRQTGATTSAFGQLDLADSDARTGILPLANGGTGQDFSNLTGHSLQVIRVNAGETGLELAAVASGGANPAGSGNEIQYRVNGTTFGAVSGASSNGTKIDFSVDPTWTKAGQVGTLAWTPTGTRTATMFDATDTVVGKATADILTNKTINASNNTITDTSIAQYDLLMADATPKFVRFAKSASSSRVLVTSATNVVTWSQVTTAMIGASQVTTSTIAAGTAGQFLTTTSGPTVTWGNAASLVQLGGGTMPSTGLVQVANGTFSVIVGRTGGGSDMIVCGVAGNNTRFGEGGSVSRYTATAGGVVDIGEGSNTYLYLTGSRIECWLPVAGGNTASNMFQWDTASVANAAGTTTLTAAQYSRPYQKRTGSGGTVLWPANNGGWAIVRNEGTSNSIEKVNGQTGVNIATANTQILVNNGTDMRPGAGTTAN